MQADALNTILELRDDATKANRLETFIPAIKLGNEVKSIEHLQENRSRFRGAFATSVIDEFAAYLKAHKGDTFIDPKGCIATAFLNLGTSDKPGHADWTAKLELAKTAAYVALMSINGHPQQQRAMAEWVEDWGASLKVYADRDEMPLGKAVSLIRDVTVAAKKETTHTEQNFGTRRTGMEEIEAKAKEALPTRFVFRTAPYLGLAERDFPMRLSIVTGERPFLVLRVINDEAIQEDILKEFATLLTARLSGAGTVTIGTFKP